MIDIFVTSILVALIELQKVATVEPSLGAVDFQAFRDVLKAPAVSRT